MKRTQAGFTLIELPVVASEQGFGTSPAYAALQLVWGQSVPTDDGWRNPVRYASDGYAYTVGSLAKDGGNGGSLALAGTGGPTSDFDCDIIFAGGLFVQWPTGTQY